MAKSKTKRAKVAPAPRPPETFPVVPEVLPAGMMPRDPNAAPAAIPFDPTNPAPERVLRALQLRHEHGWTPGETRLQLQMEFRCTYAEADKDIDRARRMVVAAMRETLADLPAEIATRLLRISDKAERAGDWTAAAASLSVLVRSMGMERRLPPPPAEVAAELTSAGKRGRIAELLARAQAQRRLPAPAPPAEPDPDVDPLDASDDAAIDVESAQVH